MRWGISGKDLREQEDGARGYGQGSEGTSRWREATGKDLREQVDGARLMSGPAAPSFIKVSGVTAYLVSMLTPKVITLIDDRSFALELPPFPPTAVRNKST